MSIIETIFRRRVRVTFIIVVDFIVRSWGFQIVQPMTAWCAMSGGEVFTKFIQSHDEPIYVEYFAGISHTQVSYSQLQHHNRLIRLSHTKRSFWGKIMDYRGFIFWGSVIIWVLCVTFAKQSSWVEWTGAIFVRWQTNQTHSTTSYCSIRTTSVRVPFTSIQ